MKFIDMTGQKFGRLLVLEQNGKDGRGEFLWKCLCDCGKIVSVRGNQIRSGKSVSCGCYNRELVVAFSKRYIEFDISGDCGVGITRNGIKFYFDLDDFEKIKNLCWHTNYYGYVTAHNPSTNKPTLLHRYLLNCKDDEIIDHIDRNKLNNRRKNLRITSQSKNIFNSPIRSNNTTGITGVVIEFVAGKKMYRAQISKNYQNINLGRYEMIEDAIEARRNAEIKYFGEHTEKC